MGNGSVSDGELSQVVADHLGSDLDLVEGLSVVNSDNRSNHLREDHHVSKVSLDDGRLLIGLSSGLGLVELLHQARRLSLESMHQSSSSTGVSELNKVLGRHLHEILEVNTSVGELLEGLSLAGLNFFGHVEYDVVECVSSTFSFRTVRVPSLLTT